MRRKPLLRSLPASLRDDWTGKNSAIGTRPIIVVGECTKTAAARLFQSRPSLRSLVEVVPLQSMDEAETRESVRGVLRSRNV